MSAAEEITQLERSWRSEEAQRQRWLFANPLRQLRKQHRWTRTQAANEIACSSQTIYQYETGGMTPGVDRMMKIAELLGTTAELLAERWAQWFTDRPSADKGEC